MRLMYLVIFGMLQLSIAVEMNITKLGNCADGLLPGEDWPLEIQDVHYDFNENGFIDHVYGTYLVRTIDTRDKELTITMYKCSIDKPNPCEHKMQQIKIDLHCEKFRNDASGIWYMISQAMSGSTCGHETGLFEFEIPRINHEYFREFLEDGEQSSRYRMHLLFHKKSEESIDRRACADIEFDVFH